MTMLRRTQIRSSKERGQSTVETALTIIVIFTVIFWVFEICNLMYTYTVISDAAHEGARYAVVRTGITADDPDVIAHVQKFAKMSMHNVDAMTVTVELPDSTAVAPHRVVVRVSYAYVPYLSAFMSSPPSMSTYAEGRMIAGAP